MMPDGEAHALRRYVHRRVHGLAFPEYYRYDGALRCWVASDAVEAAGRCDGRAFRQVCRPSLPWCPWLGPDTRIASDHALQAFFELRAAEPQDWYRLLREVSRSPRRALGDWRQQGREAITRVRMQGTSESDVCVPSALAEEFRMPGKGMRSLREA